MNKTLSVLIQRSIPVSIGLLFGCGILSSVASSPAHAQAYNPQPLQDLQTKDAGNGLFNSRDTSGSSSSLMNLIHNAIQGNNRSGDDFASEQETNLNDAAAKFRAKQAEQLRLQRSTTSPMVESSPSATPAPAN